MFNLGIRYHCYLIKRNGRTDTKIIFQDGYVAIYRSCHGPSGQWWIIDRLIAPRN